MAELDSVLASSGGKASGPDGVHPLLLRKLPSLGRQALLSLLNRSFVEGRVPSAWRRADIVPIPKKGKPKEQASSYRPISLLSCVSKVLEALLGTRLERWAEELHLLPDSQSGFRKGRSTLDTITTLAQSAFDDLNLPKMHRTLLVAIDFSAAFDRVWRGGLLRRLADAGIPRRWLRWLRAWLADRFGRVRWNNSHSSWKKLSQGVPQGSPLSPLLFILATSSIPEVVRAASPDCRTASYADDLTLATTSPDALTAAALMQPALDAVARWSTDNYMTINVGKTEALLITTHVKEVNAKARPPLHLGGPPSLV